jgi:ABC-type multidrug transport system fused ATPase/permease subunit
VSTGLGGTSFSADRGPNSTLRSLAATGEGSALNPKVARRLFAYLRPYSGRMLIAFVAMLVATGLSLAAPLLMRTAIDDAIAAGDMQLLIRVTIALAATFLALFGVQAVQRYLLSWVGQRTLATLRIELFRHLQELSLAYHHNSVAGVTMSRVINDVAVINEALSQGLIALVGDSLVLIGIIVAMLALDTPLALTTFAVLPVMILATYFFSRSARKAFRETRVTIAGMVGTLAESIAGMRVIQAFAQVRQAAARFVVATHRYRDAQLKAMSLSMAFTPAVELLGMVATGAVLFFGGLGVASGHATLGIVVAFLAYVSRFFQPIQELAQLYASMQSAMAGGEKVLELLDTKPDVVDLPGAPEMPPISGKLEFREVDFRYREDTPVLDGVQFTIAPGETVAFVGHTGAGKTTISSLLARFYDVDSGGVFIDGIDVRSVQQRTIRAQMAMVSQDPFLFPGTIADNIRFGRRDATDAEVESAAHSADLHRFVERLPHGYATQVLEFGTNVSVGQRQLISIARAVLVDPRIIILDEATSSVDIITEMAIQASLERLLATRTAIIIAHRLSTVRAADRICVVDQHRIVESGRHEQLLAEGGRYATLYRRQFAA